MKIPKKNISVTVISSTGQQYNLRTFRGEYRNLMMLIYDQCLEEIGDCKGIALCGTCHVHVLNSPTNLEKMDHLEENTLSKQQNVIESSRLSCQIMIDEKINGMVVKVLGET